jgi:hypothetical protein
VCVYTHTHIHTQLVYVYACLGLATHLFEMDCHQYHEGNKDLVKIWPHIYVVGLSQVTPVGLIWNLCQCYYEVKLWYSKKLLAIIWLIAHSPWTMLAGAQLKSVKVLAFSNLNSYMLRYLGFFRYLRYIL